MANKQGLIEYLSRVGKTSKDSWVDLALMFEFRDGETARKAWLKHRKSEYTPGQFTGYASYSDPYKEFSPSTAYTTTNPFVPRVQPTEEDILKTVTDTIKETMNGPSLDDLVSFRRAIDTGKEGKYLLELALFDLHIGKLATKEECGEDYNESIAVERYKAAIADLLSRVDTKNIDRILLPVGNDFVHVDSRRNTTTYGTPQDCSTRYTSMITVAKKLLIDTINKLSLLAPVDIIVIHGNHDTHTMFALGEMLNAYYHKDSRVTVDNSPTQRKYYAYHTTAIQFTHGNEEKHTDLPLIFASEKPRLWGLASHRYCQLGHYHKSKKMNYVGVDSLNGVEIQILPSLSSSDAWHQSKGYIANKQAKAFLFDKNNGLISEFTYHG
jgi:hypothetical protein